MTELKAVSLAEVSEGIRKSVKPVSILWQAPDTIAFVARGREIIYCPAGVRHSPRFSPDSFLLVLERRRRPGERDRFFWYCEKCHAELYQAVRHVADYREDPVSRVYDEFYSEESHRTCGKCGHVTPRPAS